MSKPAKNIVTGSDESPPELRDNIPLPKDVKITTKRCCDAPLPVDVVLLTVKQCEFLACYMQLSNPYRCWFDKLGYVYFDDGKEGGDQEEKVKVALLTCYGGSSGPGGSLISVANAVSVLRPKAVISVGACSGLKPEETKLGDVVVCAKLSGQSTGLRSCVSSRFLKIIKHSGYGWKPPLKEPDAREVEVHCDGEFVSGPQEVRAKWLCEQLTESHTQAIAIEMEGEGVFTAAFDDQIEWLIVKGIADFADVAESITERWSPFASVMAASVVSHILSNPVVFHSWPRCEDSSESTSKRESSSPSAHDPKRIKLGDSSGEFLKWCQNQLCSFYNTSSSQVMISPWDPDNTVDIDDVYVELSFVRDDKKPAKTTKQPLEDYCQIFEGRGHHLTPNRILVYGRPGIGKSTFAKKVAVDWSRGKKEILKCFDLLLLVKLRDVCEIQDLCSVLKKAELLSADDPAVFDQLYDYILQNQRKILLVLDGFDEYSAENSSEVHKIWRGSQLRDCSVLVTTRLTKEAELRPKSNAKFKINGFSRERIIEFALRFLMTQEGVTEFMEFLSQRDLWGMAEVPLLLLMLCLTWKEKNQQELPTSRASLYESFLETLFNHAKAKFPDKGFTTLSDYKEDLSRLGKVAFDALLEDCLYIRLSQIPDEILDSLIPQFMKVGFFHISKLSSSPHPEQVVCFLHKSIQEYLSACYIKQELTNANEGSPTCLSKVHSFGKIQKMVEVLKFACGLSLKAAKAILSHLQIIGEKEGLTDYRFSETPHLKDLSVDQWNFCAISLDCVLSHPAALCPLYFHAVNNVLVIRDELSVVARDHLLKFSDLPESSYLFFDWFTLDDEEEVQNVVTMLNDLESIIITCYGDTMGVSNKHFSKKGNYSLFLQKEGQNMILYFSCIGDYELLRALTSAPEPPPEKLVDQLPQNEDSSKALHLTENMSVPTVKHSLSFLREIRLENLAEEGVMIAIIILYHHHHLKQLTELKLRNVGLESEEAQLLATVLSHLCQLQELDLSFNPLGQGIIALAKQLPSLPHLTDLDLRDTQMGKEEVIALAPSLPSIAELKILHLSCNPLCQGIIELAKYLPSIPHLADLYLYKTQMGEEEVIALAHCLPSIAELKILDLAFNPLCQGIIELAKYLPSIPHLAWLDLSETQMGEEEVRAVARVLKDISELQYLKLADNPLGRGVSELTQHLSSIPQLKLLDLFGVEMTKKEFTELYTAVQGTKIMLDTSYDDRHFNADGTWETRLYTEDELEEHG